MKTISQKQHSYLIKQYHTLCNRLDLDAETKASMVAQYGVESSKQMRTVDLAELCHKLELQLKPELAEMDLWRKRLMASIGGWLKLINHECSPAKIKGVACRAAQKDNFNDIPKQQLINLYSAFTKKQKDFKSVTELTIQELDILTLMN